ncbi:hypothetical protein [Burkholderia gladioli]|uniref:hypothetical protein n=1 Tax=Burkholderia gladioli TaxID=28095 RepID=UPI0016405756|nr:hypothetical protein [Burkholderia gladioli]MDR8090352.1 hypothetical protein [Burkholderia gladioli]
MIKIVAVPSDVAVSASMVELGGEIKEVKISVTIEGRTSSVRRAPAGSDITDLIKECIAEVSEPVYEGPFFRIKDCCIEDEPK